MVNYLFCFIIIYFFNKNYLEYVRFSKNVRKREKILWKIIIIKESDKKEKKKNSV